MADIHPTAVVSGEAELADDVVVGPYVVIDGPVRVGPRVHLIAHVHLCGDTEIGEDCVIHPFAALGGPPQDYAYKGQRSYCRIGARNIIREGVTVHRGTHPESETIVGSDCMLMANSHVAHNCKVGNHVVMVNGVLLAGHVQVGDRVTLGGLATAHQFVRIGEYAMIGGAAKIEQDAVPFMTFAERCECMGVNRIGLKRNGFAQAEIEELRVLHRKLFRSGGIVHKTAVELMETVTTAPGKRLLEFVLSDSKRGVGG